MKDVTSTSFGLIIAYLLPGLAGLYALSFWCEPVENCLSAFLTASSSVGLFLLVALLATAIGLQVSLVRWLVFECILCRANKLSAADFAKLSEESKLTAFRAVVDEHYRYHQFWGGLAVLLPFLFFGTRGDTRFASLTTSCSGVMFIILLEVLTIAGGIVSYRRYIKRAKYILLGGNNHAERLGKGKEAQEENENHEESQEES